MILETNGVILENKNAFLEDDKKKSIKKSPVLRAFNEIIIIVLSVFLHGFFGHILCQKFCMSYLPFQTQA